MSTIELATAARGAEKERSAGIISPERLAHFVLRTSRFAEMIAWYRTVLGATPAFENDILCFLSYDEEHHRVALLNVPGLAPQPDGITGVHHVAFTYKSLADLMATYERLRDLGILPVYPINHGPTTSIYYADPDGNQIELQADNYDTVAEATKFFYSDAFRENPIGVPFDPEDLLRRLRAGEPESELRRRPDIGEQGLADIKLR